MDAFEGIFSWRRWPRCVIDGDFIRPEGGSILAYSLSDLFNEDISYDEVDWVREGPGVGRLAKTNPEESDLKRRSMSLHDLFASLDPYDDGQVKRWHELYGPLYFEDRRSSSLLNHAKFDVRVFQCEQKLFSWMMDLLCLLTSKGGEIPTLEPEAMDFAGKADLDILVAGARRAATHEEKNRRITEIIDYVFQIRFDGLCRPAHQWSPVHKSGLRCVLSWECNNLLAALYLMAQLDMTGRGPLRRCENSKCRNFFRAKDIKGKYCSQRCKDRARDHRKEEKKLKKRKDEAIDLYNEGHSISEIARLKSARESTVQNWLKGEDQ